MAQTLNFIVKSRVQGAISRFMRSTGAGNGKISSGDYLNVGPGKHVSPGLFSIDYSWTPGLDMVHDITKGIPAEDDSISGIFTEHCLEHISIQQNMYVLQEFHRILKPGCIARIIVPDGRIYLDAYQAANRQEEVRFPYQEHEDTVLPFHTPMVSVNRIMRAHGHLFIYDFETLREVLKRAGFSRIEQKDFMEGDDPKLLIDREFRKPESLYVEATK